MFSRKTPSIWQQFAQAKCLLEMGFARFFGLGQDAGVADVAAGFLPVGLACYPFPSLRPGPQRVRLFFYGQSLRVLAHDGIFHFYSARKSVESSGITNRNRGRSTCVNPFSFSPFLSCRWLAACRTQARALLPVRRLVPSWQMPPTTAPLPVRSSAALPALPRARCLRPSARATNLTPAFGRADQPSKAIRAFRPDGLLHFASRPGRSLGGEPCSRKS